ncbi:MAG: hypothetical protein PHY18_06690 [Dehalococcoidales bacterium]|nr:hypothetical protein [Dehalococcoidales bacterium]
MRFFSKKLTAAQQAELESITYTLDSLRSELSGNYDSFYSSVNELYDCCRPTTKMILIEPIGAEELIPPSKKATEDYLVSLLEAQTKLTKIELPTWCKKKQRKSYEDLQSFLKSHVTMLHSIIIALSPPDALKTRTPDGAKLNMFVSGMNFLNLNKGLL